MKPEKKIPFYAPDGSSLGFRSAEAAQRLMAGGFVKPSYGRKGHLKAIWMQRRDGSNPVQSAMRSGTRYSYLEQLEHGHCWHLKRLDRRDENGVMVNTRPVFLQVLTECMAR